MPKPLMKLLLKVGKENMSLGGEGLSIVDKPFDTRQIIATDLNWSTGKVAMAETAGLLRCQ